MVSSYYASKGFYPVTATNYNNHTHHCNKAASLSLRLASISMQCISRGTMPKDDMVAMLYITLQEPRIRQLIKTDQPGVTNFNRVQQSIASKESNGISAWLEQLLRECPRSTTEVTIASSQFSTMPTFFLVTPSHQDDLDTLLVSFSKAGGSNILHAKSKVSMMENIHYINLLIMFKWAMTNSKVSTKVEFVNKLKRKHCQ